MEVVEEKRKIDQSTLDEIIKSIWLFGFWLVCVGLVLSLGLSGVSSAARPLSTDDTGTVERAHWEIEFGTTYLKRVKRGQREDEEGNLVDFKDIFKETGLERVIKYGLLENWDIGLTIPYIFIDEPQKKNRDGFKDIEVSTKYRLFEEKAILPSYALGLTFKSQSANEDKGLGSGQTEISVNNIFSKAIGRFTTHLNLGYNFLTKRKGEDDTFSYGLALEYPLIREKLNLVTEITGETSFKGNFDENISTGLVGFNYAITDWLTFDLGSGFGISKVAPEYKITIGFTLSF